MFRTYTVSVPIVATATITVMAEDEEYAIDLACHVLSDKEPKVVTPYLEVPVLLDFDVDPEEAIAMSEEERTR